MHDMRYPVKKDGRVRIDRVRSEHCTRGFLPSVLNEIVSYSGVVFTSVSITCKPNSSMSPIEIAGIVKTRYRNLRCLRRLANLSIQRSTETP